MLADRFRTPRSDGRYWAILALWAVLLALPYLFAGSDSYVRIHDCANISLPRYVFAWSHSASPLSRFLVGPLLSLDHMALDEVFNVDGLLFAALPGWAAYGGLMLLQRLLAALGTFVLMRNQFRVSAAAATFAGALYALFYQPAINNSWAGFTHYDGLMLPSLPLMLWAVWRLRRASAIHRALGMAALGLWLAVAGVYAFAPFVALLVIAWGFAGTPSDRRIEFLASSGLFLAAWIAAESPALRAALAMTSVAYRVDLQPPEIASKAAGLAGRVVPWLSSNAVLLATAAGALLLSPRASHTRRSLLVVGGWIAAVLALTFLVPLGLLLVGRYPAFQIDRFYLLLPLLGSLAGGLAFQNLSLEVTSSSRMRMLAKVLLAVMVAYSAVTFTQVERRMLEQWRGGHRFSLLTDSGALNHVAERTSPDGTRGRAASVAVAGVHPAYAWAYGVPTVDGAAQLYTRRYHDYWKLVIHGARMRDPVVRDYFDDYGNHVSLAVPQDLAEADTIPFDALYDTELLSLAGVRWIVSARPLISDSLEKIPGIGEDAGSRLYRNPNAFQMAFVVDAAKTFGDEGELLEALRVADTEALRTYAYLLDQDANEVRLPAQTISERGSPGVTKESYEDGTFVIRASANRRSLLVVAVPYDLGWEVTVNGQLETPVPVDHAFLGVALGPGTHLVECRPVGP